MQYPLFLLYELDIRQLSQLTITIKIRINYHKNLTVLTKHDKFLVSIVKKWLLNMAFPSPRILWQIAVMFPPLVSLLVGPHSNLQHMFSQIMDFSHWFLEIRKKVYNRMSHFG